MITCKYNYLRGIERLTESHKNETITLVHSTRNERANTVLREVISDFESAFAGRVQSYYVEGSLADGSEVTTSDIDLHIVFHERFLDSDERKMVEKFAAQCVARSAVELDLELLEEQELLQGVGPNFKLGSLLIYGEDIREQVPLWPLEMWARDRMHSSYWRTVHLCQRPTPLRYPLTYPDPAGEFYGYDRRILRLPDGREVPCTRDLIRLVGWSATALLAFQAGIYVARKSDCHKLYREAFHDEHAQLLQDVYELCRGKWNYLLPSEQEDREILKNICERTLLFENHFLQLYRAFLLDELRNADPTGQRQALWVLKEIPYADLEVREAVARLAQNEQDTIRIAARETLEKLPL